MITKIKAVRFSGDESSGPSKTITLGFRDAREERDYILGIFYIGPYMDETASDAAASCERTIDSIVGAWRPI